MKPVKSGQKEFQRTEHIKRFKSKSTRRVSLYKGPRFVHAQLVLLLLLLLYFEFEECIVTVATSGRNSTSF